MFLHCNRYVYSNGLFRRAEPYYSVFTVYYFGDVHFLAGRMQI